MKVCRMSVAGDCFLSLAASVFFVSGCCKNNVAEIAALRNDVALLRQEVASLKEQLRSRPHVEGRVHRKVDDWNRVDGEIRSTSAIGDATATNGVRRAFRMTPEELRARHEAMRDPEKRAELRAEHKARMEERKARMEERRQRTEKRRQQRRNGGAESQTNISNQQGQR